MEHIIHKCHQFPDLEGSPAQHNAGDPVDAHPGKVHHKKEDGLSHAHELKQLF